MVLFVIAGALFASAIKASRAAALKIIFDTGQPGQVVRSGPYRYIRHPFYTVYILFWLGCAVATQDPVNVGYGLLLVPTLVVAALGEEKNFGRSERAADYAAYRQTAGLFWPRFWQIGGR